MAEKSPIAKIPPEIENQIIGGLEPLAAFALSKVNRHYQAVVSLDRRDILRALEISREGSRLACFTCLRLKLRDDFTVKNTKGRRGKNGSYWFERCCLSCCFEKKIFSPGAMVRTKGGQDTQLICIGCKRLTPDFCKWCLGCRGCAERRDVSELHMYRRLNQQIEGREFSGGRRLDGRSERREFCRGRTDDHSWNQGLPQPTMPMYDYVSGSEGSASPTRSDISSLM